MHYIKVILSSLFLSLFLSPAFSQVIFEEDFESVPVQSKIGDIPEGWILYNDNNQPSSTFSYMDKAWKVTEISDGNKRAISTSWFTNPTVRADRWMITPSIDLADAVYPYLIYFARSGDSADRDSYLVKLSTGGVEKDDFAETLFSVSEESYAGKSYALSLEQYKGDNIHIAFILNSLYKYSLYFDDILVVDLAVPIVSLSDIVAPKIITVGSDVEISAKGYVMSHTPVTSYRINYTLNDGDVVSYDITGVNIENLQSFSFDVPAFRLEEDAYEIKLWLSHFNGIANTSSDVLSALFEVTNKTYYPRKTLMEVFSSSTCGPCAGANVNMKKAYTALNANTEETNLYVLKCQVPIPSPGDPAVTDESLYRAVYYSVNSAPQAYINGVKYMDSWNDMEDKLPSIVANNFGNMTPFSLEATMRRDKNHYHIDVDVTNTGVYDEAVLQIAFLEDSIYHAPQSNGETMFYNVFRKSVPTPYGETLTFTESGERRLSFEYTFDMQNPKIFHTLDNVSAIVFLQDNVTKEILQATYVPAVLALSSIGGIDRSGNKIDIMPNPCREHCTLALYLSQSACVVVDVYDMNGRNVYGLAQRDYPSGNHSLNIPTEMLLPGFYIVKVNIDGAVTAKKILRY
jgi:hypothetical protein